MAKTIIDEPSRTFIEYRFHPGQTSKINVPEIISLVTPLVRYNSGSNGISRINLNTPFSSAVMQSVSGPDLSIALANEGGISFIFCSQPVENQAGMVRKVKNHKAGFVKSDTNLGPGATLEDVLESTKKTGHSTIPITSDGGPYGKLLGLITDNDYWPTDSPGTGVRELMTPLEKLDYGTRGIDLSDANQILRRSKRSCIPIVRSPEDPRLESLVFKKDYLMHKENPLAIVDDEKRLIVGAGVNTRDYEERIPALADAGVDVLVVDTSDGFSDYVADALKWSKERYDIPIGAGNIIAKDAFYFLAENGADFVKVGIGGGSICITQEQKGIGRGQATALIDIAEARAEYTASSGGDYVPICSDGGLVQDSHILMALGLGADFVMMGRYFARCHESPPELTEIKGQKVKPYWGEGSDRAKNWQRYHTGGKNELAFEEGVEGFVPYAGYIKDVVQRTVYKLKSTMSNIGCRNLEELHDNAVIERASLASMREGKAHDIIFRSDNMGTYDSKTWG